MLKCEASWRLLSSFLQSHSCDCQLLDWIVGTGLKDNSIPHSCLESCTELSEISSWNKRKYRASSSSEKNIPSDSEEGMATGCEIDFGNNLRTVGSVVTTVLSLYPSHWRPHLVHLWQAGFNSSHFICLRLYYISSKLKIWVLRAQTRPTLEEMHGDAQAQNISGIERHTRNDETGSIDLLACPTSPFTFRLCCPPLLPHPWHSWRGQICRNGTSMDDRTQHEMKTSNVNMAWLRRGCGKEASIFDQLWCAERRESDRRSKWETNESPSLIPLSRTFSWSTWLGLVLTHRTHCKEILCWTIYLTLNTILNNPLPSRKLLERPFYGAQGTPYTWHSHTKTNKPHKFRLVNHNFSCPSSLKASII